MSVKKEFAFKMVVDTGQGQQEITKVVKNLKEFDDRITQLNKEIRTTDFGSEKFNELNVELQRTRKAQSDVIEESKKQAKALSDSGASATGAKTGFLALQKQIKELNVEISKAAESGDEETYKKLTKQLKEVEDQAEMTKIKNQSLGQTLSGIGGPVGGAIKSLQGLNLAFKALVLNPIGAVITALVLAFTTLYKAFESTAGGAKIIEQAMAGISAVLDVLRDRVLVVGEAIVKFITGDFVGAFTKAKEAVSGIGEEIVQEFQQAARIKKELQDISTAQADLNVERARQNKLLSEARQKLLDENLSYKERKEALEQVRQSEIKLAQTEEQLADRRLKAIKERNSLSDTSKEQRQEERDAEIELLNAQQKTADTQRQIAKQFKVLRDKENAENKKREEDRAAAFKDANDKISAYIEEGVQARGITREEELERERIQYEESLKLAEKYGQDTVKLTESYRLQEKAINDKYDKIQLDKEKKTAQEFNELQILEAKNKLNQILLTNEKESDLVLQQQQVIRDLQKKQIQDQIDFLNTKTNLTSEELLNLEKLKESYLNLQLQEKQAAEDRKKYADEQNQLTKEQINQQIQGYGELAGTIVQLGQILGEKGKENKSLAIAEALINTYLGISQVWGNDTTLPEPFGTIQKVASTAVVAASGFKSVEAIRNVDVGKKSSNSKSNTSASVPRPRGLSNGGVVQGIGTGTSDSIPTLLSAGETVVNARSSRIFAPVLSAMNAYGGGQRFNNGGVVGMDQIQSLAMSSLNSSQNGISTPIQAYVVSKDMTSQQMFDRAQKTRSTI